MAWSGGPLVQGPGPVSIFGSRLYTTFQGPYGWTSPGNGQAAALNYMGSCHRFVDDSNNLSNGALSRVHQHPKTIGQTETEPLPVQSRQIMMIKINHFGVSPLTNHTVIYHCAAHWNIHQLPSSMSEPQISGTVSWRIHAPQRHSGLCC